MLADSYPHLEKENALLSQGIRFVAGLDEAGRGAWAGPVVAAAVILPLSQPDLQKMLAGLRDSKMLTVNHRLLLYEVIQDIALQIAVGTASAAEVDQVNVVGATRLAMERALNCLRVIPEHLLIDHVKLPAVAIPQSCFPKADNISLSVAAASVIAKVTRDRWMIELHKEHPAYAFDRHKGYGTSMHRAALVQHGPCPQHRLTFEPVAQMSFSIK
jgi:ribonuclease HII